MFRHLRQQQLVATTTTTTTKVELHSTDLVCDEAVAEAAEDILLAKDLGIETTPLEKVKEGRG
jgi:hypothetical protein